MSYFRTINN